MAPHVRLFVPREYCDGATATQGHMQRIMMDSRLSVVFCFGDVQSRWVGQVGGRTRCGPSAYFGAGKRTRLGEKTVCRGGGGLGEDRHEW